MKLKYLLIPATVLALAFSGAVLAKKPEGKGNPHAGGPDARWENSNKQSDEYSLRGRERADERHRLKESKKHKMKKGYYDHDDRYKGKHDRYKEKYKNKTDKYERRYKKGYDDRYDDDRYKDKHDRYKEKYKNKTDKYERRYKKGYDDRDDDDRYERKRDRYEQQRYEERYRNNPIDAVIDRNVKDAKSKIDKAQRKAIDSIDNKSRELSGEETRRDRTKPARPWWSIFGGE